MNTKEMIKLYDEYVMNSYIRVPLSIVKGKGVTVWDAEGKEYMDFFPGWAVSGLGHCHPAVVDFVKKQAEVILHVSNNYYHNWQAELAKKIVDNSFKGKVFFSNSGAEANECAIKAARKYGKGKRYEIITTLRSFHGRTMACIAATGQDKVKIGFEPMLEGFKYVEFNDIDALKKAVSDKTVAFMFEVIQGEGGINIADQAYLAGVKQLCKERDILLIIDEVQTGMGRTGKMFAYQNFDIDPDIMSLAKSLGGGLPIGATVAKNKIADLMVPGTHGSTFGGSPIVCAAALGVFEAIEKGDLLKKTREMGKYLVKKLYGLKKDFPFIKEVRGIGLMVGVELSIEGDAIYKKCMEKGLLINCTQKNVLRILPPMIITEKDIDSAIKIINDVMKEIKP